MIPIVAGALVVAVLVAVLMFRKKQSSSMHSVLAAPAAGSRPAPTDPLGRVVDVLRRRTWARRSLSGASLVMVVVAVVMLGWPFFTNVYQARVQQRLDRELVWPELEQAYKARDVGTGDALTRIKIDAIGVDVVVVEGTTMSALRAGAGHYPQSPLPCEAGNVAIAGHRTTYGKPFHNLDLLKPGDTIVLETPIGSCTYKMVKPPFIVAPTDTSVIDATPVPTLTLTTCHPKGSARQRLVVQAELQGGRGPGLMRRLLATAALAVTVLAFTPSAHAQDGYSGGWTDPAPSAEHDGKPLAYLDHQVVLTGQVSHPNGIQSVGVVYVPDANNETTEGCAAETQTATVEQGGSSATYRMAATFPCNRIYEMRATAQASPSGGLGGSTPGPYVMPLLVTVAIPPQPVSAVDAFVDVDDDDPSVTLTWEPGREPDLLGYVINRTVSGDTEMLGQVDVTSSLVFVDTEPPAGASPRYDVIAVREGPDDEIEQVASEPTGIVVDVPDDRDADVGDPSTDGGSSSGDDPVDPTLAGEATTNESQGRPDAGSLSSVSRHGAQGRPTPPTTADTGFSETIDYGEPGAGEEALVPSGDDAVVALYDETITGSPWSDKETMSFVAGGLAVLTGAGVVLTVTRRAARAAY